MAAKQGKLAQLSAQAEDAKRAVLTKAGVGSSSWFSNLNTVCTIKSAPPRNPEVLQLLATKAGWLYKRNEQHVWQARWCCVVPHTFLYYFDAPAVGGSGSVQNPPTEKQEVWNNAVKNGLGNRKQHEKRSNFSLFHGGTAAGEANTQSANGGASPSGNIVDGLNESTDHSAVLSAAHNLQPAGIIDLECYSTIYRSTENQAVLELAGDDQVNPDLRAFYFCCESLQDVEEWNTALLNNRHSALQDEAEAYKQVADGFAQQLQMLHESLDESLSKQEDSERELYRVRSSAEETRRTVYQVATDCWDRGVRPNVVDTDIDLEEKRAEFRRNMLTIRNQDMGVAAAVRLMADYCTSTEDLCAAFQAALAQLKNDLRESDQTDQAAFVELQTRSEAAAAQHAAEKEQLLQQLAAAQAASQAATKELQDVQKDLSSTKMEVTMLMQQQRNKLATQQQHKKILKKEVIDLRQKVEDIHSEHSTMQHEYEKLKMQMEQERSKSDLMSRYVDKMESQVQVQQNMMEMMSQAGSVYGGGMSVVHRDDRSVRSSNHRGSPLHDYASPSKPRTLHSRSAMEQSQKHAAGQDRMNGAGDDDDDAADDDFVNDERMLLQPPNLTINTPLLGRKSSASYTPRSSRGGFMSDNDVDNKSHVSELTEDRTQREFAAILGYQQHHRDVPPDASTMQSSSPRVSKLQQETRYRGKATVTSPRQISLPPSFIIGVKTNAADDDNQRTEEEEVDEHPNERAQQNPVLRRLETINSSSSSVPPPAPPRWPMAQTIRDAASISSTGDQISDSSGRKLSVAERARLEADLKSTPVRARLDEKSLSSLSKRRGSASNKLNESFGSAFSGRSGRSPSPAPTRGSNDAPGTHARGGESTQSSSGGLWRRMEEAILGQRDSDDDSLESDPSTRVTDLTDDSRRRDEAKIRFARKQRRHVDEKKSSDSISVSNLSLQERCRIQRDKQLRFLREQGLINDASDVKGGAGALDNVSVSSSTTSPSKFGLASSVRTAKIENHKR